MSKVYLYTLKLKSKKRQPTDPEVTVIQSTEQLKKGDKWEDMGVEWEVTEVKETDNKELGI